MAVTITVEDTHTQDGRVVITLAGLPQDMDRNALKVQADAVRRKVLTEVDVDPFVVHRSTLQVAVQRGTITAQVARALLSLEQEAGL